jgi:hypothetical protein
MIANKVNELFSTVDLIEKLETETDYDVLSHNEFEIHIINRFEDDGNMIHVFTYNKSYEDIKREISILSSGI